MFGALYKDAINDSTCSKGFKTQESWIAEKSTYQGGDTKIGENKEKNILQ